MKFAILCFDRCSQLPGKKISSIQDGGKIWKEVTSAVMEPCVNTVLKHLVHGELLSTIGELLFFLNCFVTFLLLIMYSIYFLQKTVIINSA